VDVVIVSVGKLLVYVDVVIVSVGKLPVYVDVVTVSVRNTCLCGCCNFFCQKHMLMWML